MGQVSQSIEGENLRFSRRLVNLHVGALAAMIAVVLGGLIWISEKHNALAAESAEKMVRGGIGSFEDKALAVVRDYSKWTEAYDAISAGDADWLYNNLGTGATETGAVDMVVLAMPDGQNTGWIEGSEPQGETGLLPAEALHAILGLLDGTAPGDDAAGVGYRWVDGTLWSFAITRIVPTDGVPSGTPDATLARQVHGRVVSDELLRSIGEKFLMEDLRLGDPVAGGGALPVRDASGDTIAHIVWTPPAPGAEILRQVALPLALALGMLLVIAGLLTAYVIRSARRLETALASAEAASRSKSEFLANVSHELRTPMHGIIGLLQVMQRTELGEHQREMLVKMRKAADAQMVMIQNLFAISHIEAGTRVPEIERFEPEAVLREIVDLERLTADKKNLSLALDLTGMDRPVVGDAGAFRQVVANLVGNAVKFTETGEIQVEGRLTEQRGEMRCVVSVRDTGPGIAPKDHARIFERFTQADSTLSRHAEGTGLGLWISRKLAVMTGGSIRVESALGKGSTFTFDARFEPPAESENRAEAA